jgi:N6-L-threonylcarbamoyladenine synthase
LKPNITILAIETSCDETAASVIINGKIHSNIIATQEIHSLYGGIVPELASRAHQQLIVPVVNKALNQANITKYDLNAVAFTQGPGLLGALLVGSSFAKSLAYGLNIPAIGVNHMQAHILSHFIADPNPQFPFICLTVSGGHTQIVLVRDYLNMEIIGQTNDDAVGEAFDKTAKLLGLPYPGGPLIDKYAALGNPLAYKFPLVEVANLDFSFSGIKTAFMYFLKKETAANNNFIAENLNDICASVQHSLINILIKKLVKASEMTGVKNIAIAGGVSANKGLRNTLVQLQAELNWKIFIPEFQYCTDNAAMVAIAAHFMYQKNIFVDLEAVPIPNMAFVNA